MAWSSFQQRPGDWAVELPRLREAASLLRTGASSPHPPALGPALSLRASCVAESARAKRRVNWGDDDLVLPPAKLPMIEANFPLGFPLVSTRMPGLSWSDLQWSGKSGKPLLLRPGRDSASCAAAVLGPSSSQGVVAACLGSTAHDAIKYMACQRYLLRTHDVSIRADAATGPLLCWLVAAHNHLHAPCNHVPTCRSVGPTGKARVSQHGTTSCAAR